MAERDPSELDLAAAFRVYLEDAPTQVRPTDLARQFATAYPHGRTRIGAWRFAAVPRLAWLVLLAALLAALVGGALLVGSQQRRLPAVVPPVGQLFECPPRSNPDKPGPVDQARPPDYGVMAFDRRAGRLVALADAGDGVETWTFDVCTNTWTQMHPNRVPSSSEWPQLVYDVDSDTTIFASYRSVWAYDLQTDSWTEKRVAPTDAYFIAYDPVSGRVIAGNYDPAALWEYDVETDAWTPIRPANGPEVYGPFAHDASVDRMVMYAEGPGGSETWLLDLRTSTWSQSGAEMPAVVGWMVAPGMVYDEAAERTLVLGRTPLTAYDATADRWEILAEQPYPDPSVYDAANQRLVGWGMGGNDLPGGTVVALDLATREWTVLLEPGEGQAAP
jgi:hypothetical protein